MKICEISTSHLGKVINICDWFTYFNVGKQISLNVHLHKMNPLIIVTIYIASEADYYIAKF